MVPGWVRSTSLSCSTTGGVHRVEGIVISTGPTPRSSIAGVETVLPRSSGWSLLRSSRPCTAITVSSTSRVLASW